MRHILSLNENWQFRKQDRQETQAVTLPHTWKIGRAHV